MNDMPGGAGGPGGFNDPMEGDKPLTVTSVLKEFQGLKDKFKNEDEDDCEWRWLLVVPSTTRALRALLDCIYPLEGV